MFKIKINCLTYIFIALFIYSGFKNDILIAIFVLLIHELGHVFFCKLYKVKILCIEIYPFGGIIKLHKLINYPIIKDLFIASGGILFQMILCIVNYFFIKNPIITFYNSLIMSLNLIPVIPLDGSKVLQIVISSFMSYYSSLIISYIISLVSLLIIIVFYLFFNKFNIVLIMFSLFFLCKEIRKILYVFNKFLLERYLYNFSFKKSKKYKRCSLKKLQINRLGYFYVGEWKSEQYFLRKKFDKRA